MKDEILARLRATPAFVQDSINEEYTTNAITKIRKELLGGDKEKAETLKNMVGLAILKDVRIENLFEIAKVELSLDDDAAKEAALIILQEVIFPLKDFFPGTEDEIKRLGGEIPTVMPKKLDEQLLKREEEIEAMQEFQEAKKQAESVDMIIQKSVKDLIREYPIVEEQVIGSQKAIELKSMPVPMKPIVKYWIADYYEKIGYTAHSNMDRVQYVYHDKNTRSMNDEERRQLNLILKSLDEGIALPYSTRMKKIDFSRTVEE